jgi:hypothetical protein
MQYFTISKERETFDKNPLYHLRSLRNAISHANFNIDANNEFTFWDHPPMKPEKQHWHWEARITESRLLEFLHILADATHRIYAEIRNGQRKWPL